MAARHLPDQDVALAAAALTGLLVEGLIGPLAPDPSGHERDIVQSLTLAALRALGVADARARGLVVQTAMPADAASALAARSRNHLAKQLPGLAVELHQLHLLDRREVVRSGRDGDARQQHRHF